MVQTATPTKTHFYKDEAVSQRGMVATKHPVATQAGTAMLEVGGNAVDAAVAACLAVGVVEPGSSGIGGGGYLTYQVGEQGGVVGFPMRASKQAAPAMYETAADGATGSFGWVPVQDDANIHGFRSIAVPGAVAGLTEAHRRLGRLPLADVVQPAVRAAREGYSPDWYTLYTFGGMIDKLLAYGELRRIFLPGDRMPSGGSDTPTVLKQPELADVLEAIGRDGAKAMYRSDVTAEIVSGIQDGGGILTEDDFASYRPYVWERGLELSYRGLTVRLPRYACAGPTSAMTLKLVRGYDLAAMGHNSAEMLHAYISSAQLAYADRFRYFGDNSFVDVPWKGLLSDEYADRRRAGIGESPPGWFNYGDPWQEEGRRPESQLPASLPAIDDGTTHLCAMDGDGNAVSLTNTLMSGFGSGVVPPGTGVVMNNGMMWFDPLPGRVNSIEPGKAGLNNMTPRPRARSERREDSRRRFRGPAHHQLRDPAHHQDGRFRHGAAGSHRRVPRGLLQPLDQRRSRHRRKHEVGPRSARPPAAPAGDGFARGFASPVAIVHQANEFRRRPVRTPPNVPGVRAGRFLACPCAWGTRLLQVNIPVSGAREPDSAQRLAHRLGDFAGRRALPALT